MPEAHAAWYPGGTSSEIDSVAFQVDRKRCEEVHTQKLAIHNRLIELENKHQELNQIISRGQEFKSQISPRAIVSKTVLLKLVKVVIIFWEI